ncbi:unnamed protein product [Zymoseptoria tritici ST99CH_3D7]|uniref:Uncharacterized protein n=2 Tax=Zymoseptoria tritici TaxID=1047171 RepID=A0A1X7RXN1_ZYMT9|nr:unnamed protein product [Zymoseptoria tritici ST99CH_3D7]SMR54969.1 unnamed protein product [Zymoseptoria tritici ST99CH_1E4]
MANNKMAEAHPNDTGEFAHMLHVQQGILASFGNGSDIQETDQSNRLDLTTTEEHVAMQGFAEDEQHDDLVRSFRAEQRNQRLAKAAQEKREQERMAEASSDDSLDDDPQSLVSHQLRAKSRYGRLARSYRSKRKRDIANSDDAAESGKASKSFRCKHKAEGGETKAGDSKTLVDLELELAQNHRKACEAKLEILEAEKEELKLAIQRQKRT